MAAAGLSSNRLAGLLLMALFAVIVVLVLVGWQRTTQAVTVVGRMPEAGGWDPGVLRIAAGQPLHLRLTSSDVMHGFAVGRQDLPEVPVIPGEVTEVTLTFDQPGTYTYYCTRWCGPNHWRMRGTIEVSGTGSDTSGTPPEKPLYLELGLDLDAPHPAAEIPSSRPSAARGDVWLALVTPEFSGQEFYRAHSPAEVWQELRAEGNFSGLDDNQLWDLVAALWRAQATPEGLAEGQELYAANCAACHGETGQGDGVFAREPHEELGGADANLITGHEAAAPTDFTAPEIMLGASPARLQGKIVRGGMGTGMPYWGSIFTEEQTWALVSYMWTFQFDDFTEVNQ